jgi:hypothetical protein
MDEKQIWEWFFNLPKKQAQKLLILVLIENTDNIRKNTELVPNKPV